MPRSFRARLALAPLALAPAASAQAFIDWGTYSSVYAETTWYDQFVHGTGDQKYNNWPTTLDMHDTASTRFTDDGFDGMARARADVVFPPGATIGSRFSCITIDFDAYAEINASNTQHVWEQSIANATQEIGLRVTNPTPWSFAADVSGDTDTATWGSSAVYSLEIWNTNFTQRFFQDELRSEKNVGDFATHVSVGGTLQPGSYVVRISAAAGQADAGFGDAIGSARATISNGSFCTVPAPATLLALSPLLAIRRRR